MNEKELEKAIQRVGMGTFVKYFEAFSDESKESHDLVEALIKIEGYGHNSAKTKVNSARRILNSSLGIEALKIIENSQNTDSWVIPKATFLKAQNEN